ncbi:MAG TPA: STT3 domain-containing protein [Candidatus Binatia bacterium]
MTRLASGNAVSLILALACVTLVIWIRSLPAFLPGADELAQKIVDRRVREQLSPDVMRQFPPERWMETVDAAAKEWMERNPAQVAAAEQKALAEIRSEMTFTAADGRSYTHLGDYDSYVWLRNARTYLSKGTTCDAIVGGECRDTYGNAPVGYRMVYNRSLHIAAIVAVHRLITFFRPGYPLLASAFLVPIILGALGVLPAFFIARRLGGNVAAIVAALAISLDPNYLIRSAGSDNDVWNIVMPLYIAWPLLVALTAGKASRAGAFALIAGFLTGVYAAVWRGWIFTFSVVFSAAVGCLALALLRQSAVAGWRSAWRAAEVRAIACAVAVYYIAAGVFTSFTGASAFSTPFISISALLWSGPPAAPEIWPLVMKAVSEMGQMLPVEVVQSMGGLGVFFAAWLGLISLVLPVRRLQTRHIVLSVWVLAVFIVHYYLFAETDLPKKIFLFLFSAPFAAELSIRAWKNEPVEADEAAVVLILLWCFASLYELFEGARFIMFLAIPFGFALGSFAGRVRALLQTLFARTLSRRAAWTGAASSLIALSLVLYPVHRGYASMKNYYPAMNDAWWDTLAEIKSKSSPDAIVNTWWDYGYWVKYAAQRRVSTDGGTLWTHIPHWLAKALIAPSDVESRGILRMLNCASDATPLPEGRFSAFGKLTAMGLSEYRAYEILTALVKFDRAAAARYLADRGFSADRREAILASTHCRPPDSFLVVSREMIAKAEGWTWLGSWDVRRAYLAQRTRLLPEPQALEDLARLDYRPNDAKAVYDYIGRLKDEKQIDNFIAPPPRLIPAEWIPCRESDGAMACIITITNSGGVNRIEFRYDPAAPANARLMQGERSGAAAALIVAGTRTLDERLDADAVFGDIGVLLDLSGRRILVGSPLMIRSTLVRLFYLDGRYSGIFSPFARKTTLAGEEVASFKIDWQE